MLEALAVVGFDGVWVDRFGYSDRGSNLEGKLRGELGEQALASEDGRFSFFDLRLFADAQRDRLGPSKIRELRAHTLAYPRVRPATGFAERTAGIGSNAWHALADASIEVTNRFDRAQRVVLRADVASASGKAGSVVIAGVGRRGQFQLDSTPSPIRFPITLPPGKHQIRFTTTVAEMSANVPVLLADQLEVEPEPPRRR